MPVRVKAPRMREVSFEVSRVVDDDDGVMADAALAAAPAAAAADRVVNVVVERVAKRPRGCAAAAPLRGSNASPARPSSEVDLAKAVRDDASAAAARADEAVGAGEARVVELTRLLAEAKLAVPRLRDERDAARGALVTAERAVTAARSEQSKRNQGFWSKLGQASLDGPPKK